MSPNKITFFKSFEKVAKTEDALKHILIGGFVILFNVLLVLAIQYFAKKLSLYFLNTIIGLVTFPAVLLLSGYFVNSVKKTLSFKKFSFGDWNVKRLFVEGLFYQICLFFTSFVLLVPIMFFCLFILVNTLLPFLWCVRTTSFVSCLWCFFCYTINWLFIGTDRDLFLLCTISR